MTRLLDAAMQKVSQLPLEEQDRIAQLVLDELDDEARWQETFAGSQDKLARLAENAREEIGRGEVKDEDPSTSRE
jgi:hypothetical protein